MSETHTYSRTTLPNPETLNLEERWQIANEAARETKGLLEGKLALEGAVTLEEVNYKDELFAQAQTAFTPVVLFTREELLDFALSKIGRQGLDNQRREIVAEETLQESYQRIFRGLPGYRGEAKLRTWMCAIVKKRAFTLYGREIRHLRVQPMVLEDVQDLAPLNPRQSELPQPENSAMTHDRNRVLKGIIDTVFAKKRNNGRPLISAHEKEALYLRHTLGLSHADSAKRLGISETALKVRYHRATHKMVNILKEMGIGSIEDIREDHIDK